MGDPLFFDGVGLAEVLIVAGKVLAAFTLLLVAVILMIWFERKVVSDMHNRIGPNLAGPWGLLQTLADGMKLIFKEDLIPSKSDRFVFKLAPFLSLVPAFLTFAVVPLGGDFSSGPDADGTVTIFGHDTFLQVADAPIGILLFLAMSSLAVYGVMLAGWSSGSKYPLLGSVRASAQMISYEAALGLAVATVLLQSGTLSTHGIALSQSGEGVGSFIPNWNLITTGFVPFVIFLIAGTAELNRPPFDLVEAEQELVGGFHTEYSSFRFAVFFLAEYMNMITMGAIIVTLFMGGPAGPALIGPGWIWGFIWFFAKLMIFLFSYVWVRASLPRLRYDQLMDLGWKLLIPVALGWFLTLGMRDIGRSEGWSFGQFILAYAVAIVIAAVATTLLLAALRSARMERMAALEPEEVR